MTCTSSGQVFNSAAVGMTGGTLTCPNIPQFCGIVVCPNYCSKKGICHKGSCLCTSGWGGPDCNTVAPLCHYSCSTCTGLANNQCLTCPATSNRISTISAGNTCDCLDLYLIQ